MCKVVVLNSALQEFLEKSLLNNIFLLTNISMEAISSINLFRLDFLFMTASTNFFTCVTNMSHVTKQRRACKLLKKIQCFVRTHYINDTGIFLWIFLLFMNFFLNNAVDTMSFNSVGKMSHIFGSKLDIVSDSYLTVLIALSCSAVLFLRL